MAIEDVAVIGAGPSGLTMIKALLDQGRFKRIVCFERGPTIGGLWNYDPRPPHYPVPSLDAHRPSIEPWASAMYDELETNVERDTMTYGDTPLPPTVPLFMGREAVLEYVRQYGKDVEQYIQRESNVEDIRKDGDKWAVTVNGKKHLFDAVAVATGNFNMPNLPDRPGLEEWDKKYPGSIMHSKEYRTASPFSGKKVVIVGGSISAMDIGKQLIAAGAQVLQSIRNRNVKSLLGEERQIRDIVKFDADAKTILDEDGQSLDNVDHVIFATGYLRWLPALREINKGRYPVVTDGMRLHNVYLHLFYTPDPSLVFLAAPVNIVPFPTAEAQAIYTSLVWTNQLQLPPLDQRVQWEQDRVAEVGDSPRFHRLKFDENVVYQMLLAEKISECQAQKQRHMQPRTFDEYGRKVRAHILPLKLAHEAFKKKMGRSAYSIEEMRQHGCFEWDPELSK